MNRLLAVAACVYALPALLELCDLFGFATFAGGAARDAWIAGVGALLVAGFAWVLRIAPSAPELRVGRALFALLAAETAILALGLVLRLG